MKLVEISNTEERKILFGLSFPERYITDPEPDPWWKEYVLVDKPGVRYEAFYESMLQCELLEWAECIEKSKLFAVGYIESVDTIEPDYSFDIGTLSGTLNINMRYGDSLEVYLTRDNLDEIASYIKNTLNSNLSENHSAK